MPRVYTSRFFAALVAGIAGACAGPVIDRRVAGRLRINPVADPVIEVVGRIRCNKFFGLHHERRSVNFEDLRVVTCRRNMSNDVMQVG